MARAKGRAAARRARKGPGTSQATVLNVLQRHKLNISLASPAPTAGALLRLAGPTGLIVSPTSVDEQTPGAIVGVVTVFGPPVNYVFTVADEFENGSMWIVLSNVLQLAPGEQVFYADAAQRTLDITATAPNGKSITIPVLITVNPAIVPPPPPLAPTGITIDNSTFPGGVAGATVGTLTATDPNLPVNTISFSVFDSRFTVIPIDNFTATLRLVPAQVINNPPTSSVTVTVRATNGFGLFLDVPFVLNVTPNVIPGGRDHSSAFSSAFS